MRGLLFILVIMALATPASARDKMVNGVVRSMTLAEEALRDLDEAAHAAKAPRFVVSFDAFESRFTTEEWDATTDFVYAVSVDTGVPLRRALLQKHSRAIARNSVDLHDDKTANFMAALVDGEVISQARSDQILDPSQSSP